MEGEGEREGGRGRGRERLAGEEGVGRGGRRSGPSKTWEGYL